MISLKHRRTLLLLALLSLPSQLHAAQPPFDIDVKELDRGKPAVSPEAEKKKTQKPKKPAPAAAAAKSTKGTKVHQTAGAESEYLRYTVKPGDHIFKILVARFGMSNEAAERLIPEIIRVNNITNIKNLTVGRTLLIPSKGRQERVARLAKRGKTRLKKEEGAEAAAMLAEAAKLEAQGAGPTGAKATVNQVPPASPPERAPSESVASAPAVAPTVAAPGIMPSTMAPASKAPTAAAPAAPAPPAVAPTKTPTAKAPAASAAAPEAAPSATASGNFPAAPAVPQANTWVCSVTEKDPARIVDAVMNSLSISWSKNRIIRSDGGAANAFSIRVDRYFELKGLRYVVSIGERDPYSYTLIRLLESAGYRVLMINSGDDFKTVGEKLLRFVGLEPDFGKHALQGGTKSTGFLVQQDDAGGRPVVITNEAVDPKLKWAMPAGCGAR